MKRFRCYFFLPLIFIGLISAAWGEEVPHVLLLNSYHYGLSWTDDETKGVREILEKSGHSIELHVEYMDAKRLSDENHLRNIRQLLQYKYRNTRFSSILVTDNDAFNFLRKYRNDQIFAGVPVIFAGVNYYHKEMLAGLNGFTGVAETFEAGQTVEVMKRLHPGVKRIVVVIDGTITGESIRKDLEPMLIPFAGQINFEFWDKLSLEQLRTRLPKLDKDTLVLLMPFARDSAGTFIRYSDMADMVSTLSLVPVYGTYEFYMGNGIVGGRLTSGEAQGQAAANILLRVINGEDPNKIPVVTVSPSEFQFDSRQLHRYSIAASELPPGSLILYQSWYERYFTWVWLGGLLSTIMLLLSLGWVRAQLSKRRSDKALRESEAKLLTVLDCSSNAIFLVRTDGRFTYVNRQAELLLDYTNAELLQMGIPGTLPEEEMERTMAAFQRNLNGTNEFFETTLVRKNGSRIIVEINGVLLPGGEVLGELRDITQRKQAEQELKRSKDQLAAILNATMESIILIDVAGIILALNDTAANRFNLVPSDMLGRCVWDFVPPELLVIRREYIAQVFLTGKEKYSEDTRDGYHFLNNYYPIMDIDGKVGAVVIYASDITERKNYQLRLEHLLVEQKALLDNDLVGIVTVKDRKIIWANPAYEKMLGYAPGECAGTPTQQNYSSEEAYQSFGAAAYPVLATGKVYRTQIEHVRRNGKHIWVDLSGAILNRETGESLWGFVDITERKQAENDLRESHQQIHLLLNSMAEGVYGVDTNGNCTFVNQSFLRILGFEQIDEVVGKHIHELIHHSHPDGSPYPANECKMYNAYRLNQKIHITDEVFWQKNGLGVPVEYWSQPIFVDEVMQGAIATFVDITERIEAEAQIKKSLSLLQATLESTTDAILVVDLNNVWRLWNQQFVNLWNVPDKIIAAKDDKAALTYVIDQLEDADAFIKKVGELYATPKAHSFDTLKFKDGRIVERFSIPQLIDGEVVGRVWSFRDVTDRKQMEEQVYQLAFYDPLTKLPNRRLLTDRLNHAIASSKRTETYGALMFLDLDNFKPLNDTHGHDVGDLLLMEVANRISGCIREVDTVARFGGDEFVVMLGKLDNDEAKSATQAGLIADKIRITLAEPYLLNIQQDSTVKNTVEHHCTSSIGVVLFNCNSDREDILKMADMAMYQAKESGRNQVVFNLQGSTNLSVADHAPMIMSLKWDDSYDCGEPTIDQEHRKLFYFANKLIASAFTRDKNPQRFDEAWDILLSHVTLHFANEEEILARHHYADLDDHIIAHKVLVKHALKLHDDAVANGVSIGDLVNFLADEVVAQHMLKTDRKFYSLFYSTSPSPPI